MAKKKTTDNGVPVIPLKVAVRVLKKGNACQDGIDSVCRAFPDGIPVEHASFDLVRKMNAEVDDFYLDPCHIYYLIPDGTLCRRGELRAGVKVWYDREVQKLQAEHDRKMKAIDLELLTEIYGKKKKGAADK